MAASGERVSARGWASIVGDWMVGFDFFSADSRGHAVDCFGGFDYSFARRMGARGGPRRLVSGRRRPGRRGGRSAGVSRQLVAASVVQPRALFRPYLRLVRRSPDGRATWDAHGVQPGRVRALHARRRQRGRPRRLFALRRALADDRRDVLGGRPVFAVDKSQASPRGSTRTFALRPQFVIAPYDNLESANEVRIPEGVLRSHYRRMLVDRHAQAVVYKRTADSVDGFRTNPHVYLENVAHPRVCCAVRRRGDCSRPVSARSLLPRRRRSRSDLSWSAWYTTLRSRRATCRCMSSL